MSFGKILGGAGASMGQAGLQAAKMVKPPIPAKIPMPVYSALDGLKDINNSKQGLLGKLWGQMDKKEMRKTGVGLINQALQQNQSQPQGMSLAPFQPGGGGGMPMGGGTPQLVALAQQLGLNRVL